MSWEQTIEKKVVFSGKMLTIEENRVRIGADKEATREVVRHPGACAILVFLDNDKILLEKQFRYPIQQELIEIPAGKLDPGEDPLDCAKRELQEETGYYGGEWTSLGFIHTGAGFCDEVIHLYAVHHAQLGPRQLDPDEDIELIECTREDIKGLLEEGKITDSKTLSALFKGRVYL